MDSMLRALAIINIREYSGARTRERASESVKGFCTLLLWRFLFVFIFPVIVTIGQVKLFIANYPLLHSPSFATYLRERTWRLGYFLSYARAQCVQVSAIKKVVYANDPWRRHLSTQARTRMARSSFGSGYVVAVDYDKSDASAYQRFFFLRRRSQDCWRVGGKKSGRMRVSRRKMGHNDSRRMGKARALRACAHYFTSMTRSTHTFL